MKTAATLLVLATLFAASGPATAVIDVPDTVPAATLLLPYFEVDLDNPQGVNTLFSINNSASAAVLTKVVVWTDQSVPVIDFNVYLTGYDVQTISLRDIFVNSNVPRTASTGQDPGDTISPQGTSSQDVNFASCTGTLPYLNPAISNSFKGHIQAWLTGKESPQTHTCAGAKYGSDNRIARGYVTVDTVNACNLFIPSGWTQYSPFITDQNVLWGDWFLVNPSQNVAQGDMLVHIESCPSCFVPGDHTFYGRYNAATADDGREALPTTWGSRFLIGGAFDGGTDLLVWRETDGSAASYSCSLQGPPSWYSLPFAQMLAFDEEETVVNLGEDCPGGSCPQIQIRNETQRVDVNDDLFAPFSFGWAYLNLQHPEVMPVYGDDDAQSWVIAIIEANGRFSVGFDVLHYDNANSPAGLILP